MNLQFLQLKKSIFLLSFIHKEVMGGAFLLFATIVALFCANSPLKDAYQGLWQMPIGLSIGSFSTSFQMEYFINEVLMTLFFLLIGCELKRECVEGELSSRAKVSLPLFSAFGGMVVPALFYAIVFFVMKSFVPASVDDSMLHGWAIPTATDIAFALGVLALLGPRIPTGLKAFLMALAVIDDLGAILLIGLFYTGAISVAGFAAVGIVVMLLWALNKKGVTSLAPYLALGALLWVALHKAGIHATLAGVLLAVFIPLHPAANSKEKRSPLKFLGHTLHPYIVFGVMPLFALVNAGVSLEGITAEAALNPITVGIVTGLFLGKPIGIMLFSWLAIRTGVARLPKEVSWNQISGAAFLCGIGFTMSIFIGLLAFSQAESLAAVRLGVLSGSALSAVVGCCVLLFRTRKKKAKA